MKRIIMDLDDTICSTVAGDYKNSKPILNVINRMHEYKEMGFDIVISTSRNMRTYEGSIGHINIHTLPNIVAWLDHYAIPYDEIYVGKPWCGTEGFYVDDKAIRPDEFIKLSYEEIINLTRVKK